MRIENFRLSAVEVAFGLITKAHVRRKLSIAPPVVGS